MAAGAGADRVSSGMRESFGKPIGKAARVKKGQLIMSVSVPEAKIDVAKEALRKANAKIPAKTRISVVQLAKKTTTVKEKVAAKETAAAKEKAVQKEAIAA